MTESLAQEMSRLRQRVRSDRRTVTAPLVTFGALIVGHLALVMLVAAVSGAPSQHLTGLLYWPVAGAVGLVALWLHARRVAARDGVGEGPRSYGPVTLGYVVSVPVLAVLFVPVLFAGIYAPLVWPAAVLAAAGVRQRSRVLRRIAEGLAFLGGLQAIANLIGQPWIAIGIEGVAGLALVGFALVRLRNT